MQPIRSSVQWQKRASRIVVALALALASPAIVLAFEDEKDAGKKESPTIARLSEGGKKATLRLAPLRKKFADGGEITGFRIARRQDSFFLIRHGKTIEGRVLTDAIPLVRDQDSLSVRPPIRDLKWITTCHSGNCDGFCMPDGEHCDCSGNPFIEGNDGDPEDILDPRETHNPGASGDCTFGTAGGGTWDTVLFR